MAAVHSGHQPPRPSRKKKKKKEEEEEEKKKKKKKKKKRLIFFFLLLVERSLILTFSFFFIVSIKCLAVSRLTFFSLSSLTWLLFCKHCDFYYFLCLKMFRILQQNLFCAASDVYTFQSLWLRFLNAISSPKASSPESEGYCFLFQFPAYSLSPQVVQQLLSSSTSSSRHLYFSFRY